MAYKNIGEVKLSLFVKLKKARDTTKDKIQELEVQLRLVNKHYAGTALSEKISGDLEKAHDKLDTINIQLDELELDLNGGGSLDNVLTNSDMNKVDHLKQNGVELTNFR